MWGVVQVVLWLWVSPKKLKSHMNKINMFFKLYHSKSSKSKEYELREALNMIGVDDPHGAKMPLPMSSVKAIPLEEPVGMREVCQYLEKQPPPSIGLQVLLHFGVFFLGVDHSQLLGCQQKSPEPSCR